MANLEERKDRIGTFRVFWKENGLRRTKNFRVLVEAETFLIEAEKIEAGKEVAEVISASSEIVPVKEVPVRSFKEAADNWLRLKTGKKSLDDDESILKIRILPRFSEVDLMKVTRLDLLEFRTNLSESISKATGEVYTPQSVKLALSLIRSIITFAAVDLEWNTLVPSFKGIIPKVDETNFTYLRSKEEIERFMNATKYEVEVCQALYFAAIETGMRQGELAGLRWENVSLADRFIEVVFSFDDENTKSSRIRHIPISDELLSVLKWLKEYQAGISPLVFPSPRTQTLLKGGNPIFDRTLQRVLKRAGFSEDYMTFHDLRHTFASKYLRSGGRMETLQKYLGHSTIKLTQRYAHLEKKDFESDNVMFAERSKIQVERIPFVVSSPRIREVKLFSKKRTIREVEPGRRWIVRWMVFGRYVQRSFYSLSDAENFAGSFDM